MNSQHACCVPSLVPGPDTAAKPKAAVLRMDYRGQERKLGGQVGVRAPEGRAPLQQLPV